LKNRNLQAAYFVEIGRQLCSIIHLPKTSWSAFEVIQESGLMYGYGMNIFTLRQPNDVIPSVPFSGGFKILPFFCDCDIGICDV
jgi:hypothetical protein